MNADVAAKLAPCPVASCPLSPQSARPHAGRASLDERRRCGADAPPPSPAVAVYANAFASATFGGVNTAGPTPYTAQAPNDFAPCAPAAPPVPAPLSSLSSHHLSEPLTG